ncbi:hypothetical protein [Longispora albida]|uniref:hypothetical protein n=1 Tax=Longispora albida TaxID=203523 RepID=UPI000369B3BA|nr:hypothetical protein [Longispora albida]
MRTTLPLAVAALGLIALAGCGSPAEKPAAQASAPSTQAASAAPSAPPLSRVDLRPRVKAAALTAEDWTAAGNAGQPESEKVDPSASPRVLGWCDPRISSDDDILVEFERKWSGATSDTLGYGKSIAATIIEEAKKAMSVCSDYDRGTSKVSVASEFTVPAQPGVTAQHSYCVTARFDKGTTNSACFVILARDVPGGTIVSRTHVQSGSVDNAKEFLSELIPALAANITKA